MMNGREKLDSAVVARKPANNARKSATEGVERGVRSKGNTGQCNTYKAQNWASVSQGLERVRQASYEPAGEGSGSQRCCTTSRWSGFGSCSMRSNATHLREWMACVVAL